MPSPRVAGRSQRAPSIGVSEKLTTSEIAIETVIVSPKLLKKRPGMLFMNAIGKNTAIRERVVARTARPTSLVAAIAAGMGFIFLSWMKTTMTSSTTIASSMTMPTARARARSVSVSMVRPSASIAPKVPMTDAGIASAAMTVERTLPRNTSTTSAARSAPTARCSFTASTLLRVASVLSRTTSSVYPDGSCLWTSASRARTASTVATVFSPDCFRTDRMTAGSPLNVAAVSASA